EEMNASIDEAAANLASTRQELIDAITNGDKALDDKIAGLTTALEAAVAAAEAADEALRTELNARIDEAVAALNATIAQVQKDLEDAKAELAAKDAQLNNLVIVAIVIASISACGCLALLALILLKKRS
ncbi:MAG: hypothetical protein J6V34_00120, partial [Oscillospiraceae bacterium]|nr:hypothetical protein [Oscillospiraceae bacterium]